MMYRLLPRGVLRLADNLVITRDMGEWAEYRTFIKGGGVPLPMLAPPAVTQTLAELKRRRANLITTEALDRIQAVLPEVSNMATAQLVRELWLSIAPAARSPTPKMGQVIAIYGVWHAALAEVKACNSDVCVLDVTVAWP